MVAKIASVILVLLVNGLVAHHIAINCREHCQICVDELAKSCENTAVLLPDGDICRCCDQCGHRRKSGESCKAEVHKMKVDDQVIAKVIPVKCQHGYECVSGVCERSETGFCTMYLDKRAYNYACDKNSEFLPIECSKYHCWCINPITGNRLGNIKVPKPMDLENASYCYHLMTESGDMLLSRARQFFNNDKERDLSFRFPYYIQRNFNMTLIDMDPIKKWMGKEDEEEPYHEEHINSFYKHD